MFANGLGPPPSTPNKDGSKSLNPIKNSTLSSHQAVSTPAPELCGGGSLRRSYCNNRLQFTERTISTAVLFDDRRRQDDRTMVMEACWTKVNPSSSGNFTYATWLGRPGVELNSTIGFPTFEYGFDTLVLNSQMQRTGFTGVSLCSFAVCFFTIVYALITLFKRNCEVHW
jgi:hypothetical protein